MFACGTTLQLVLPWPRKGDESIAQQHKSARRLVIEALTDNWLEARKAYMPERPTTKDGQYVWQMLRLARSDDVRLIADSLRSYDGPEARAWLAYHPEWVWEALKAAVARGVHTLRTMKRERREANAARRYKSRSYGIRRSVRHPGPLPPITVKVPKVGTLSKLAK